MIYLDNSATTEPYEEVVESYVKVAKSYFGNPSSLHGIGGRAEQLLTQSRAQVAKLLHTKPQEIIFTSGGSEGNNLAIKGAALQYQGRGKHIITSAIEHPSVSEACKQLEQLGFEVTYLPVDKNGLISVDGLIDEIRNDTILVSIIHVNNEIGTIQPIEEIGRVLKRYPKILFHVDHVQGLGKVPTNFEEAHIDMCTISGHKFNGLKGTGILYSRQGVQLSPLIAGGGQELGVRSGTENVAGIVSMTKALRMTLEDETFKIRHISELKRAIIDGLLQIESVSIHTPHQYSAPHIINFSISGLKPEVFVHLLEEEGIIVSTTSACSSKKNLPSKTLQAIGIPIKQANSSIRISLSASNKVEEVPILLKAIQQAITKLESVMR
ncbi:cysteine desulfurase family protein [Fredinandcohnia quinoae]|uniref:Cysteine desulfurase n=1 Tax=Fredinandcohnia quinoae TaxID=2918902 RepID=A0AAW5E5F8_9BACI|nr:cysteine desulfurase family protein [Fredinandcohnia sp. SECRCQ15]MCH1627583.1 cysteine desulfurase [Fredinandcohnia sp. SECRCQ15]